MESTNVQETHASETTSPPGSVQGEVADREGSDANQNSEFQLNFENVSHEQEQEQEQTEQQETTPPAQGPYKLFVGQLPKTMQDEELKKIFEPFGNILEFNIIKDRVTGVNRGCGFVVYGTQEEADLAISNLHDKRTFAPARNPIQVKYASRDSEKGDSKKVYVGALPRHIDDAALRTMFEEYGEIDTATVLKDIHTSESRGCALIKFKSAEAAGAAVSAMNGHDVGGTGYKIVVKFAESEKEKDKRKKTLMKKYLPYNKMPTAPAYVPVPGYAQPTYAPPGITYPPQPTYAYPYGQETAYPQYAQYGQYPYPTTYGYPQYPTYQQPYPPRPTAPSSPTSSTYIEGPPNSTLFIYHLPQHIREYDLTQLFSPFGNIMGVKIFYEPTTLQSKGFAFVSFDNPDSATRAIQAMNGYQIANKRLKVSLKVKGASHQTTTQNTTRFQPY